MHLISPSAFRRLIAWGLFGLAFYLLSSFLSLLIMTFVLSFTMHSLANYLAPRTPRLSRRALLSLLYAILIGLIVLFILLITPELQREWVVIKAQYQKFQTKHVPEIKRYWQQYDIENNIATVTEQFQSFVNSSLPYVTSFLRSTGALLLNLVLSIIFSFVVLWDIDHFRRALPELRATRVDFIYEELAPHLVKYFSLLGGLFQAQILVATLNAVLTFFGLIILSIPHVALLTVFVWILGLIPVIGVIISTVPIALLCLVEGGLWLMAKSILLIILIHMIEAYILNPHIQGAVLKVHPVFMLFMIFIGEHFGGIYGIFLGIPLMLYFFQELIRRDPPPEAAPAAAPAPQPPPANGFDPPL